MRNKNPGRVGQDATGATVVQFQRDELTASPTSFQPCRTPLDWALAYAKLGWYLFPVHSMRNRCCSCGKATCESPAKHPRTARGDKDATTDAKQIAEWWARWPDANIGLATGPSGLVVLDIDGPEGQAELKALGHEVPRTLASRTGRPGGFHLVYAGTGIPSSQRKGEHIDVRGSTGYVILPPSVHANGTVYAWVNPEQPIAPVPAWVAPWIASRGGRADRGARGSFVPAAPDVSTHLPAHLLTSAGPSDLAARTLAVLNRTPWSSHEEVRLRSALAAIPADIDGKTWFSIGAALHDLQWHIGGRDLGLELWDQWSKTSPGKGSGNGEYRGRADLEKRWRSFSRDYQGSRTTTGSIFHLAIEHGWTEFNVQGSTTEIHANPQGTCLSDVRSDGIGSRPASGLDAMISAADLRTMTFDPVRYVLPGFVPEGVTLLVGRPKVGKSWWVLDLCLACAGDRATLGAVRPRHGDVLYLALEDGKRRLQRRIDKLMSPFSTEWPPRLKLVPMGGWRRADQGGLESIEAWCRSVPNPTLVVVDTLERIRKPANGKGPLYSADYEAITGLQKIAIDFGIAIIVLHHDRKSDADDAFDTVSGTLGLTGAADTILIIKRRTNGVVLYARGRDIEESETAVQFDKETCRWTILGKASEVQRSNERARVSAALRAARQPLSTKEIMIEAEMSNRNAADVLLSKMARDGEIERIERGRYNLSTQGNGRIGQKERPDGQPTDLTEKSGNLSNSARTDKPPFP